LRHRDQEDRRVVKVQLTPKGKKLAKRAPILFREDDTRFKKVRKGKAKSNL